jgi:hypothetical protein
LIFFAPWVNTTWESSAGGKHLFGNLRAVSQDDDGGL